MERRIQLPGFVLVCLLAGSGIATAGGPPCIPEEAAKWGVVRQTCRFDQPEGPEDSQECRNAGEKMRLEPFSPLRPERWSGTSMFLCQRRGEYRWVSVDPQCEVLVLVHRYIKADGVPAPEPESLVLDWFIFSGPLQEGTLTLADADAALWWVFELLRAHFAPLVRETGRPLGRLFFFEDGVLPCDATPRRDGASAGPKAARGTSVHKIQGARPYVERRESSWRVILEEWRCEEQAKYRWIFTLRDEGYPDDPGGPDALQIEKVGAAPGCDCR